MCLGAIAPIALTAVQVGMQIAAGRAQAASQRAQGEAANNYYQYLAKQNEQQALLAERTGKAQSRVVQDVQKFQGRQLKQSQAEFRASQKAALAASGVTLDSVTASDIDRNTSSKQALDEATLRFNADVRSFEAVTGAQNRAFGLRSEASGFRAAGLNARHAGQINARNTLLSTATSVVSPFIFRPLSNLTSGFAIPGLGGFGRSTPIGTRSVISRGQRVSLLPRRLRSAKTTVRRIR